MKRFPIFNLFVCAWLLLLAPLGVADIIDSIEDLEQDQSKPKPRQPPRQPTQESPKTDTKPADDDSDIDQEPKKPNKKGNKEKAAKSPIKLKSDGRSTYTKNGGIIVMRKNVVITQDELRLQADQAKIFVDPKKKDDSVEKVEIEGQVKMSKFSEDPTERVTAHGDRAIFINQTQIVQLIGNARLYKGGHLIRGKKIVYDVQTGLITVDQAQGVVQPEEAQ
ncbi:lipopolysaccharide transport periplasmic protein LptA [Pseudobacteriovorax antillogorgiicola]|uniref:Lipopolysaccharide transport protein LptA n=1 Tax=Pseudobacteriovorax antillogorgiicola TaxID=1513793 RepID=A0A1Y6B6W2_9BACT|nr:lipopolysaccharide transport periplasmic protein LptA [Pseudobacteriovorax antillogorgiicola]TCS59132.1 lipopolysaccharide transport protein LptA [Pseudobacteriovorax antillogorgiicola]SME91376.1 lipopolysaccharide transport protein LptA [Pseudobacteriovorax antillogorgiicola]